MTNEDRQTVTQREAFEAWWDEHGQYVRAGGGQYEVSFAYAAWVAATLAERERCIGIAATFDAGVEIEAAIRLGRG